MSMNSVSKQAGVGLIEVLVTLLVLSIGLLGLAGLQNAGLRYNHTAFLESQAQFLIKDIIERMRVSGEPERYVIRFDEAAPDGPDCRIQNCSSAQDLADWEREEWISTVQEVLPSSEVEIRRTDAVANEFVISIRYNQVRGQEANPNNPEEKREVTVATRI